VHLGSCGEKRVSVYEEAPGFRLSPRIWVRTEFRVVQFFLYMHIYKRSVVAVVAVFHRGLCVIVCSGRVKDCEEFPTVWASRG